MFPSIASTQFLRVSLTVVITPAILVASYNKNTFNGTYRPLATLPFTFKLDGPPILSIYFLTSFILKSIGIYDKKLLQISLTISSSDFPSPPPASFGIVSIIVPIIFLDS